MAANADQEDFPFLSGIASPDNRARYQPSVDWDTFSQEQMVWVSQACYEEKDYQEIYEGIAYQRGEFAKKHGVNRANRYGVIRGNHTKASLASIDRSAQLEIIVERVSAKTCWSKQAPPMVEYILGQHVCDKEGVYEYYVKYHTADFERQLSMITMCKEQEGDWWILIEYARPQWKIKRYCKDEDIQSVDGDPSINCFGNDLWPIASQWKVKRYEEIDDPSIPYFGNDWYIASGLFKQMCLATNIDDFLRHVAHYLYYESHILRSLLGSESILQIIVGGVAHFKGFALEFNEKVEIGWNFKALITQDVEEYQNWFVKNVFSRKEKVRAQYKDPALAALQEQLKQDFAREGKTFTSFFLGLEYQGLPKGVDELVKAPTFANFLRKASISQSREDGNRSERTRGLYNAICCSSATSAEQLFNELHLKKCLTQGYLVEADKVHDFQQEFERKNF